MLSRSALIVASISLVLASVSLAGTRYVTLVKDGETPTLPYTLNESDVVQIVGYNSVSLVQLYNPTSENPPIISFSESDRDPIGDIVTGLTAIKMIGSNDAWVTLKITSQADPVVPTQSNQIAVVPEDEGGQFDVIMESSTDLITWTQANSGTYGGDTTKRFFRVRITKKSPAQ